MQEVFVVEAKEGHARIEVGCNVYFTANTSFEVPGTSIYDKEDGTTYFSEHATRRIADHADVVLGLSVDYDEAKKKPKAIRSAAIMDRPCSIRVDVSDFSD